MDNVQILILVLVLLVFSSIYFSATNVAFSFVSKTKLKQFANKGSKNAMQVLALLEDDDHFFTSILVINTIIKIAIATISVIVFNYSFDHNGVFISAIITTIVILVFVEITPKVIVKQHCEQFAMLNISILKLILLLTKPLIFVFILWENGVNFLFKTKQDTTFTGEELITMIEEVEKDGNINAHEGELIISAIEFNEAEVQDIFTPRVDVVSVDIAWGVDRIEDVFLNNPYSRLPVYEDNIDNILGFIHERDLHKLAKIKEGSLNEIIQAPIRVTESMKISELLKVIQHNKSHLAIVIDEYGGTAGIVTLEDIIEELVGDIWDEHDEVLVDIEQINENTYLVNGSAYVEEVFELLQVRDDTEYDANTMSGWISEYFGRIPSKQEEIHYKNLLITILSADDKVVNQLKIEYQNHDFDEE